MNLEFNITDNSPLILAALPEAIEKALEAIGLQAEGHAKVKLSNKPKRIDTGLLRNSITHAVSGKPPAIGTYAADESKPGRQNAGWYDGQAPEEADGQKAVWIGTNVEYATYVHDGTSKMAPNRFIRNAVTNHRDEYKAIAEQMLKNA